MAYASIGRRFVAVVVDAILIYGLTLVIFGVFGTDPREGGFGPLGIGPGHPRADLFVLVAWLYEAGCVSSAWQATLGKKVLGIAVVDAYGQRLSFARSTTRYFAKIPSALLFGLGYLMAFFSSESQALHDRIASTLVVDASELPADAEPIDSVRVVSLVLVVAMVACFGGLAVMPAPRTADVYLVPVSLLGTNGTKDLAADVAQESHLRTASLSGFTLSESMLDLERMQYSAQAIQDQVRLRYQGLLKGNNVVIAVTSANMYTEEAPEAQFAFSSRDGGHIAVVSIAQLGDPDPGILRSREDKMLMRQVDALHYHLALTDDPTSVLYSNVSSISDIDRMTMPSPAA